MAARPMAYARPPPGFPAGAPGLPPGMPPGFPPAGGLPPGMPPAGYVIFVYPFIQTLNADLLAVCLLDSDHLGSLVRLGECHLASLLLVRCLLGKLSAIIFVICLR